MAKSLPFNRLERTLLKRRSDGRVRIDAPKLAAELSHHDPNIHERLRRAALRAIEDELTKIAAERKKDPPC